MSAGYVQLGTAASYTPSRRRNALIAIAGITSAILVFGHSSPPGKAIAQHATDAGKHLHHSIVNSLNLASSSSSLPLPSEARADADFFVQNQVYPASWSNTFNPTSCIRDYVAREGLLERAEPLKGWETDFPTRSGCPTYPIPDGGFLWHMHWEGPWGEAFELAIDSWLATQNLDAGHRLIFWYGEPTPPPASVLERYESQAPGAIEFRILDAVEVAEGTCFATRREWTDPAYRKQIGMGDAARSNLLRTLLLAKFGGVWVDSDVVFVRDLTPLLRVGPFAPAYYPEKAKSPFNNLHYYNNHIISVGPAPSPSADKMLDTLCKIPFDPKTWDRETWQFKPFQDRTTNDGLLNVCESHTHCGLAVYPLALVESETWTPEPLLKPCTRDTEESYVDTVLKRVYMWHSRQDTFDWCPEHNTGVAWSRAKVARALPRNLVSRKGGVLDGAEF